MDALPNDELLAVLQYLSVEELLGVRLVCRRWKELALHPDLWRHRTFELFESDDIDDGAPGLLLPALRLALRLAPCAARISLGAWGRRGRGKLLSVGVALATTGCATADLRLPLANTADVVLATLVIRNQASLGRLHRLRLFITDGPKLSRQSIVDLLAEVRRVEGLEAFRFVGIGWGNANVPEQLSAESGASGAAALSERANAFLKECQIAGGPSWLWPHWYALMALHSQTLREVTLVHFTWPLPGGLQASLFNAMPLLEKLACPLLEDMHLLRCDSLKRLMLFKGFAGKEIDARVLAAVDNAKAFFRRATDLVELHLVWEGVARIAASLVEVLASSGRAKLEILRLPYDAGENPRSLGLTMLPCLSNLRFQTGYGECGPMSDAVLEYLATTTIPGLKHLYVGAASAASCFHALRHHPLLPDFLARHPKVHFSTPIVIGCTEEVCVCGEGYHDTELVNVSTHSCPAEGDAGGTLCDHSMKSPSKDQLWVRLPPPSNKIIEFCFYNRVKPRRV